MLFSYLGDNSEPNGTKKTRKLERSNVSDFTLAIGLQKSRVSRKKACENLWYCSTRLIIRCVFTLYSPSSPSSSIHPFISFIHPFIHSFIHLFIHLRIHLYIHLSIGLSGDSLSILFIRLFVHSFILSFVHLFINSSNLFPTLQLVNLDRADDKVQDEMENAEIPVESYDFDGKPYMGSFRIHTKSFGVKLSRGKRPAVFARVCKCHRVGRQRGSRCFKDTEERSKTCPSCSL